SDEFCFVSARRENGSEQIRDVHSGEAQALAARQNGRKHNRARKAPPQPATPIYDHLATSPLLFSILYMERAALIRPRCVNAWGKLPSASPFSGSISSANRSTSFA